MLKLRKIFSFVAFSLCFCVFSAGIAQAASLDDIFEGIPVNSFRKAGKHLDNIADLRKAGETFGEVIRRDDDVVDMAGAARRVADDDLANLKKINFPAGSHYADDLMKLSKNQRLLAYALDDIASRVARLPNANDIVRVTGSKGLLIGASYGDEALERAYLVARQSDMWDLAGSSIKAIDEDFLRAFRSNDRLLANLGANVDDVNRLARIGTLDAMDMSGRLLKKYGKKGMDSTLQLLQRVGRWAAEHPVPAAAGVLFAAYYVNPHWLLDAKGELKNVVVETMLNAIADMIGTAVKTPTVLARKMLEKLGFGDLPAFIREPFVWIAFIAIVLGVLYFFKITRFIPITVLGWLKNGFRMIFQCIGRRGVNEHSSLQKSDDVMHL